VKVINTISFDVKSREYSNCKKRFWKLQQNNSIINLYRKTPYFYENI